MQMPKYLSYIAMSSLSTHVRNHILLINNEGSVCWWLTFFSPLFLQGTWEYTNHLAGVTEGATEAPGESGG